MPSAGQTSLEVKQDWIVGYSMQRDPERFAKLTGGSEFEIGRQDRLLILQSVAAEYESPLAKKFEALRGWWENETAHLSLVKEKSIHPAYQQIIGLGEPVIPLIIAEMRRRPGHWFWALRAIAQTNPVAPEHGGNIAAMTQDWIGWWETVGSTR